MAVVELNAVNPVPDGLDHLALEVDLLLSPGDDGSPQTDDGRDRRSGRLLSSTL